MNILIGIGGGSGAGKTTLAKRLQHELKDSVILPYDSYCVDRSNLTMEERSKINYDLPDSYDHKLYAEHVKLLLDNKKVFKPIFDFATHSRVKETEVVEPHHFIIVEGIMVYQVKELENAMNLSIYVEADSDVRLARRIKRDINERGRSVESVITQYLNTVKPSHMQYIEPTKDKVDIIFLNNDNNGLDEKQVKNLLKIINRL